MRLARFKHPRKIRCSLEYRIYTAGIHAEKLGKFFSQLQNPVIFGGNNANDQDNRFWYFAAEPLHIHEFNEADGFEHWLEDVVGRYELAENDGNDPDDAKDGNGLPAEMFKGGWAGFLSYDLCRQFENVPQSSPADVPTPLARLCFYDNLIAYDRSTNITYLIALAVGKHDDAIAKIQKLADYIELSESQNLSPLLPADIEDADFSDVRSNMSHSEYIEAIQKTKKYIYDGDVYQINFSQRFEFEYPASNRGSEFTNSAFVYQPDFAESAYDLYRWQNHFNPSPYSAYIGTDNYQIVCASPEIFLGIRGDKVHTCPIKGTKPRLSQNTDQSSRINQTNIQELLNSEKEKAELNMIIDLERNDLGRICVPGTRHVSKSRHIREYPSVYHAVAQVSGQLSDDIGLYGVLKSTFPGGSITGAPKIRAMEIIDQLEPSQRGIYTGSVGFIGIDGSVCLNIVIRTVIIVPGTAYVQTGGGIVADSDPENEWQETITKAKALIGGLNAVAAF